MNGAAEFLHGAVPLTKNLRGQVSNGVVTQGFLSGIPGSIVCPKWSYAFPDLR